MTILEGRVTIRVKEEGFQLRLDDKESSRSIVKINLTPEDFCAAVGGLAYTPCEFEVATEHLAKIGLTMEVDHIEFEVPNYGDKVFAVDHVDSFTPDGWTADKYFGSQDSFRSKDGVNFARATIRRWVKP